MRSAGVAARRSWHVSLRETGGSSRRSLFAARSLPIVDLGGAGDARLSAELAWEQLREVGPANAQRLLAVAGLGIEQDAEPEPVDHGVEAAGDRAGIESLMAAGIDHLLDQRARALLVGGGPARAEVEKFLAPARLAPEGVPDRHLLAAGHGRVEVGGHHGQPQAGDGLVRL